MHKLYEFACDELKELEKKAGDKGLSASELEYADKLTELKKNILKIEMLEDETGYSGNYPMMYGSYERGGNRSNNYGGGRSEEGSYARGRRNAKRDSMGRYSSERGYSRDEEEIVEQLEDMMDSAKDERTKMELRKLIDKMQKF